jgi:lipoprotein Spr
MDDEQRPHPRADRILAAARACIGLRFRPQGRGPEGMDCLGLALFCCESLGLAVAPPAHWGLRAAGPEAVGPELARRGFLARPVPARIAGDLLLAAPGTRQLHFAICAGTGVIEADMGLRRVVERPFPWAWPIVAAWRFPLGDV